ncbi:ABC-type branched-subunit amino acid transport system substrate-binding protein [Bradyrhizobium sp. AZCC 1678]
MTTTGLPSYRTEGTIYARYITRTAPTAKIAILYQNDDLGKDFVAALKEHLKGDRSCSGPVIVKSTIVAS